MTEGCDYRIYNIWDERWKGSEDSERLTFIGRLMFKAKKKRLSSLIKDLPARTVIEVGCGLGHTMSVYSDMGLDCIGIDISQSAVNVCRMKGLKVEQKRLEDVSEAYDLVSSDGMLEHFLNFETYARHLMRISNRYVLLIQPNHDSFLGKSLAYLSEVLRGNKNIYEYNYRIKDFVSVFHDNGFVILENQSLFMDVFRLLLFENRLCRL